jgi:hypothetical protein
VVDQRDRRIRAQNIRNGGKVVRKANKQHKVTYTNDGFVCHLCRVDNVPNEHKWVMKGKDTCLKCLFKCSFVPIDGGEIDWDKMIYA